MRTIYLDPDADESMVYKTLASVSPDPAGDDMISAYLDGGEDVYE